MTHESNKAPHLNVSEAEIPRRFFMPGDPDRLDFFREFADEFSLLSKNREFVIAVGVYEGEEFGVCSTGIGGGSAEIATIELARLGVETVVRTGGCGVIQDSIEPGSLILVTGAVRHGGSSQFYVGLEFPAVPDNDLLFNLRSTARSSELVDCLGIIATVNSFYQGQGREITSGKVYGSKFFDTMQNANVLGFDMESETILVLSSLLGISAASMLLAHVNRVTETWDPNYRDSQAKMVQVALNSLKKME